MWTLLPANEGGRLPDASFRCCHASGVVEEAGFPIEDVIMFPGGFLHAIWTRPTE